jgi:septum formation inhibitor MinC
MCYKCQYDAFRCDRYRQRQLTRVVNNAKDFDSLKNSVKELMSDREKQFFTKDSFTEEEKEILAKFKMNELKQLCKEKNVDVSKLTKKNLKITWARAYLATQN